MIDSVACVVAWHGAERDGCARVDLLSDNLAELVARITEHVLAKDARGEGRHGLNDAVRAQALDHQHLSDLIRQIFVLRILGPEDRHRRFGLFELRKASHLSVLASMCSSIVRKKARRLKTWTRASCSSSSIASISPSPRRRVLLSAVDPLVVAAAAAATLPPSSKNSYSSLSSVSVCPSSRALIWASSMASMTWIVMSKSLAGPVEDDEEEVAHENVEPLL